MTFAPNEVQTQYMDVILPRWRENDLRMASLMEIVLKARQFGFSTLIAVLFFLDTINNPNTGTVVISNDRSNAKKLFEMIDRMYRALPVELRPRTKRASTDEFFWPDIDCHYQVMTAGTNTSGRGWTINNLHCSEVGFWQDEKTIGGLLDAVPAEGNIFLESTANGEGAETQTAEGETLIEGSAFHVYYEQGKAGISSKEGSSPFTSRFFGWYQHPEYRTPAPTDFERVGPDEEGSFRYARYGNEIRLAELYGLDDDQLYWRRRTIDKPGKGPAMFAQEYPANDVEAFRTSGKKFFAGLWDKDRHVQTLEIKPWWKPFGMFDWGFGVPYAALLGWVFPMADGSPGVYVSNELYGARVRNKEQAAAMAALLESHALDKGDVIWYADPAMWAKEGQHQADNIGRSNVEDFWEAGFTFVKANNNREHGCSNMREYMAAPGGLYVDPRCENLIRTLPLVLHDPHDLEVYEKSEEREQHAIDALRYGLNSRPRVGPKLVKESSVLLVGGKRYTSPKQLPHALQSDPAEQYYS